jgi:hypothetical protein
VRRSGHGLASTVRNGGRGSRRLELAIRNSGPQLGVSRHPVPMIGLTQCVRRGQDGRLRSGAGCHGSALRQSCAPFSSSGSTAQHVSAHEGCRRLGHVRRRRLRRKRDGRPSLRGAKRSPPAMVAYDGGRNDDDGTRIQAAVRGAHRAPRAQPTRRQRAIRGRPTESTRQMKRPP